MISLFNIPNYTVDTSKFSHILNGDIVDKFTESFCKYVGIGYGCPVNSASSAIFLLSLYENLPFTIPSIIPPVVLNAILNSRGKYSLTDDIDWVGHSYIMYNNGKYRIIDSAQEVRPRLLNDRDIIIYSFYPTKPVGSCDGGMICSNNKELIDFYRKVSMNGVEYSKNSWEQKIVMPGWKMYMNSIQAHIANENLKRLDDKKEKLKQVREIYNNAFNYNNTSEHLYRIRVGKSYPRSFSPRDNNYFINYMKDNGIICGIHYRCAHKNPIYTDGKRYLRSEWEERITVSIPYHEALTGQEINKVIKCVKETGMIV